MTGLLEFFSLSGTYIEIILSSIFIANIAAITLSGNYFNKIDELDDADYTDYYIRKISNTKSINNALIPSTTKILESKPHLRKKIEHNQNKRKINNSKTLLNRGWKFTLIFLISEFVLISGLFILLILGILSCDIEICKIIIGIFGLVSLIVFTIGILLMGHLYYTRKKEILISINTKNKDKTLDNIITETKNAIDAIPSNYMPKSIKNYYDCAIKNR